MCLLRNIKMTVTHLCILFWIHKTKYPGKFILGVVFKTLTSYTEAVRKHHKSIVFVFIL